MNDFPSSYLKKENSLHFVVLILCWICFSCSEQQNESIFPTDSTDNDPNPHYIYNRFGDSIPTGTPIQIEGKTIDNSKSSSPKRIPLRGSPKVVSATANIHTAGKPRRVSIPANPTVKIPGKDGVQLPKEFKAIDNSIQILPSQIIKALPPRMKQIKKYNIHYLDEEQGMQSSTVTAILEDRRGHIWIGSDWGLSRYDGNTFKDYKFMGGLPSAYISAIFEDRTGEIWIGTYGGGLLRYDGIRFLHYSDDQGFGSLSVHTIYEDVSGNIWFGTRSGAIKYNGTTFIQYTIEEGMIHNNVTSVVQDNNGNLWFGTFGGICCFDGMSFSHFTQKEGLLSDCISSVCKDRKGNLWFGTGWSTFTPGKGVCQYDGIGFRHYTKKEGLSGNYVSSILEDREGNLWFGTHAGLNKFDGNTFTHITEAEGLTTNRMSPRAALEDRNGNLWFGSHSGGLIQFNQLPITYLSEANGLSDKKVCSMLEDRQGRLWFGTWGGGVNCLDNKQFTQFTIDQGLPHNVISSIAEDHKGNLWFGTWGGGASYFDGYSFLNFSKEEGLHSNLVRLIMVDGKGGIWFVNRALDLYDGQKFVRFSEKEGLPDNQFYAISEDLEQNIWLGTMNAGLIKFDGKSIHAYSENEGLLANSVVAIEAGDKDDLWLVNEIGVLSHFKNGSFSHLTYEKEPEFEDAIISLLKDRLGRLWAVSGKGIHLFLLPEEFEDLNQVVENRNYKMHSFHKLDGIGEIDAYKNNILLDKKDRLWMGSPNGLTVINLNEFNLPQAPPEHVQISNIDINQNYIDFNRLEDSAYCHSLPFGTKLSSGFDSVKSFYNYPTGLNLPCDINHLTFHFTSTDWAGPHKIKYSFFMEGLENEWSLPSSENKADYRNLPHGTYTLKVKAIGAAQVWSEPFEYTFTIRPPWWHTLWAYGLFGLMIMAILYGVYRYQLSRQIALSESRRLKELDEVKTRLYTNITHEFRTPLTVIQGMTEKVRETPQKWLDRGTEMVIRNSRHLLRLVNQMLDLSKLESGKLSLNLIQADVVPYLHYLVDSFHSYAEMKRVNLHLLPSTYARVMDYDPERLMDIVSNLLSNAIKFTPEGGNIYVSLLESGHELVIEVKDTGMGIPEEKLPHIFDRFYQADDSATRRGEGTGIGLALTRELVRLMKGTITVESTVGKGTQVRVALPITQIAPQVEHLFTEEQAARSYVPVGTRVPDAAVAIPVDDPDAPLALIVEDHEDVVNYVTACLEADYRIEIARNGQEGIDKALALVPDIIVSDVMMPEKDGFEVCDTLKQDMRTSHIPVILLTAKADVTSRISGLKRGADAYLAKPFNEEELLVRMAQLLELRQRLQQKYNSIESLQANAPLSSDPETEMEDRFILQVREVVEAHLSDYELDVSKLCKELGMSRAPLHNKLKALTGKSTTEFIRFIRLSRAREMLISTDLNISEIGYETGFQNPNYFTKRFGEVFGETPSEYRENSGSNL